MLSQGDPELVRREMIARVKRQAQAQEEEAAAAQRKADTLVAARKTMADDFNMFRMRIILIWAVTNAALVVIALTFNPTLTTYGAVVTATVVFQVSPRDGMRGPSSALRAERSCVATSNTT